MESIEKLKHFFNDLKDKFDPHPKGQNELINLVLTTKQKKTMKNENFMLFELGVGTEDRIICYATNSNLQKLMACDTWLADGTFSACPKIFY